MRASLRPEEMPREILVSYPPIMQQMAVSKRSEYMDKTAESFLTSTWE